MADFELGAYDDAANAAGSASLMNDAVDAGVQISSKIIPDIGGNNPLPVRGLTNDR